MTDISSFKNRSEYTIIKSLSFATDFMCESYKCCLDITLCKDVYTPDDFILVKCIGVSNLSIDEIGGGISQITQLDFEDISERQWDGLNYYVFDYENEVISFYCNVIEFNFPAN